MAIQGHSESTTRTSEAGRIAQPAATRRHGKLQPGVGEGPESARRRRSTIQFQRQAASLLRKHRTVIDGLRRDQELIAGFWLCRCDPWRGHSNGSSACPNPRREIPKSKFARFRARLRPGTDARASQAGSGPARPIRTQEAIAMTVRDSR